MSLAAWRGILIPFLGTSLGASSVFFLGKSPHPLIQRGLTGFAARRDGRSVCLESAHSRHGAGRPHGALGRLPGRGGFWLGILFLLLLDRIIPHLHMNSRQAEGPKTVLGKTAMLVLAVTLHNLPEGMAVGVVYAGLQAGSPELSSASALALSLGIAIQNFPEGAIISMPMRASGRRKISFVYLRRTIRGRRTGRCVAHHTGWRPGSSRFCPTC